MPEIIQTVKVGGKVVLLAATFARPGDTTAYSVGDVVSNSTSTTVLMKFTGAASDIGGSGYVTGVKLKTDQATCTAQFRLFLFTASETTVTVPVDNAANTTLWANRASSVGYVDLPALSAAAGTNTAAMAQDITDRVPFQCASTDSALYGLLVTNTAFTPANAQNFYVELVVDQN